MADLDKNIFASLADKIGADYLATGHYIKTDGKYFYQAEDDTKDQSYFLFYVHKDILPRLLFPLGDRKKSDINNGCFFMSENLFANTPSRIQKMIMRIAVARRTSKDKGIIITSILIR